MCNEYRCHVVLCVVSEKGRSCGTDSRFVNSVFGEMGDVDLTGNTVICFFWPDNCVVT